MYLTSNLFNIIFKIILDEMTFRLTINPNRGKNTDVTQRLNNINNSIKIKLINNCHFQITIYLFIKVRILRTRILLRYVLWVRNHVKP